MKAQTLGHNTSLILLVMFVASAVIGALAGAIYVTATGFVAPDMIGLILSTEVIMWVAVGGLGSLIGAALGAMLVWYLQQQISSISTSLWPLFLGCFFVLMVFLFPDGLPALGERVRAAPGQVTGAQPREEAMRQPILSTSRLTRQFGGLTAVDNVSIEIDPGTVQCIIGPNGAGKSTLLNLPADLQPSSGEILYDGKSLLGLQKHEIARLGIARKFQVPTVFNSLTVEENLIVAETVSSQGASGMSTKRWRWSSCATSRR